MSTAADEFWLSLSKLAFASEADVEVQFVLPLLRHLGWSDEDIHSKVPVKFRQGRSIGRRPEADFVVADPLPRPPTIGRIVIEAKSPTENLDDAEHQAFSYSYMLRAPLFLTTNGVQIQIWRTGYFENNVCLVKSGLRTLASERGKVESLLAKDAVLALCRRFHADAISIGTVDLKSYLDWLVQERIETQLNSRFFSIGTDQIFVVSSDTSEGRPFKAGERFYFEGLGGRGKTSSLHLLVARTLRTRDEVRVPLYASLKGCRDSLFVLLCETVRSHVPQLATPSALLTWLRSTKTLLALDDWDALDKETADIVATELSQLTSCDIVIALAGRAGVVPPPLRNSLIIEVGKYSEEERDKFIASHFLQTSDAPMDPQWLLSRVPSGAGKLLCEPVILSKYLSLISYSYAGGVRVPGNVPELMQELLTAMLASRHFTVKRRADEIHAVCVLLARQFKTFGLEDVHNAISDTGLDSAASALCDDLVASGLWQRLRTGVYSFSHDIWATYFQMEVFSRSLGHGASAVSALTDFVRDKTVPELHMCLPFIAGRTGDPDLQDLLFRLILDKDLALYLSSLEWRKETAADFKTPDASAKWVLEQLYKGRVELVESYFPALRDSFDPWLRGDGDEEKRGEKPVLCGQTGDGGLNYYFGFGLQDGDCVIFHPTNNTTTARVKVLSENGAVENVMGATINRPNSRLPFAPVNAALVHYVDLDMSGCSRDSGRLISAKDVLNELQEQIKHRLIPLPKWSVRERFKTWMHEISHSVPSDDSWADWPLRTCVSWLEEHAYGLSTPKQLGISDDTTTQIRCGIEIPWARNTPSLPAVLDVGKWLLTEEQGDVKLKDLGLPGPDLDPVPITGLPYFWRLYSPEQKARRLCALFDAAIATYKELCETYFPKAAKHFFYGSCPCRAVVEIPEAPDQPAEPNRPLWYGYYWEPVREWGTPAQVTTVSRIPFGDQHHEIMKEIKSRCARFGREANGLSMTWTGGHWGIWDEAITEVVLKLISSDIKRLQDML